MVSVGVDAGSRAIKMVILDPQTREMLAGGVADQGIKQAERAEELLDELLAQCGKTRDDIGYAVATGYGRDSMAFADQSVTEITCHGYGVALLHPEVKTIIDIGGQDSKVIRMGEKGRVKDFSMNDRCAAGTGRFMEVVGERLEVPLGEIGRIAASANDPSAISSMCVVFAETEIVGLMAQGVASENIVAGVCHSVATRVAAMAGRNAESPVIFTGGVSRIEGMEKVMAKALGLDVSVAKHPQLTGALGAALIASSKM